MITKADFSIKVEPCIDSEDWVWSLYTVHDDRGAYMDGYSGSEAEAWVDARKARAEEVARLNEEVAP